MTHFDSLWVKGRGIHPFIPREISATMMSEEFCKVLSSNLTEVSVTFVTSGMHTVSNFKMASVPTGLFSRLLTPNIR